MDGDLEKGVTPVTGVSEVRLECGQRFQNSPLSLQEGFCIPDVAEGRLDVTFASLPAPLTLSRASVVCSSVQSLDEVTSWLPGPSLPFLLTLGLLLLSESLLRHGQELWSSPAFLE